MKYLTLLIFLLALATIVAGETSRPFPPSSDIDGLENNRRSLRRLSEELMPRSGGDDLFYRDIKNLRIGIGTSAPESKLDVWGTGSSNALKVSSSTTGSPGALVVTNEGNVNLSGSATITGKLTVRDNLIVQTSTITGAATQALQEAVASSVTFVSPLVQHYHPSAAKAWAVFQGTGTVTIRRAYNITSITDNGAGDYTLNFTTAFSDANYVCTGSIGDTATTAFGVFSGPRTSAMTTTTFRFFTTTAGPTNTDYPYVHVVCYGDQ